MQYYSLNRYVKNTYGRKLYKISINGGFTCPNRDGTIGTGGCIFCLDGSGAFAGKPHKSVSEQIEEGKNLIKDKIKNTDDLPSYIAYFQSYTGTYAPIDKLRTVYLEAATHPDIAIVSIATRPDCLGGEVISLLKEINAYKPVWIELGLQTIHEDTASLINRGYTLEVYDEAMAKLKAINIPVVTHVILGLPSENTKKVVQTVKYAVKKGTWGIKLQLLHVLKNTALAEMYKKNEFNVLSLEEYADMIVECLRAIPKDVVIHRITGDGDKRSLIAPLWSADKKKVLNYLNKRILEEED